MKPTKSQRNSWKMDRIITIDIESYDWVNPVALGMYNGCTGEYRRFLGENCINKFVDEMMKSKYRSYTFVAHYGGKYDFGFIIDEIVNRNLDYWFLDKQNSIFFIQVKDKHNKTRKLQDSFHLIPGSLKQLAHDFTDMEKGNFDVNKIKPLDEMPDSDIKEMETYLYYDCVTLYKVLEEFNKIISDLSDGNCTPQLTIGSTTMSMFRSMFQEKPIPQSFIPDKDLDFEAKLKQWEKSPEYDIRKAYFGGRTEVYKKKGENLKHYDVNSLFPYVFTNKPMPIGKVHTYENGNAKRALSMSEFGGVAKISATVKSDIDFPVLPYRFKVDNTEKVIFPTGLVEGWYSLEEIRYADRIGQFEDINIHKCHVSHYGNPFEKYGNHLYELKRTIDKEENPAKYYTVKILMNSFYGKFALDREQYQFTRVDNPIKYLEENPNKSLRPINEKLEDMGIFKEPSFSNAKYIIPRIAVAITANARIEMHKWFMKVKDKGGNIWYCDTDSIITDIDLPTSPEMGGLDLENKVKKGYFLAPKVYAELLPDGKARTKAKGMTDNPNSFYAFEKAYEDNIPGLINASWDSVSSPISALKENKAMYVTDRDRSLKQFDEKRIWEGNNSQPIEV